MLQPSKDSHFPYGNNRRPGSLRARQHVPIIPLMSELTPYSQIVVHGVGLIGGSVAAAVKRRWPECRVTGIGRRVGRLQAAQDAGLLDDWALCLADANVDPAAIVVICLPVDLIVAAVIESAEVTSAGVLITDAGSVKQSIQDGVARSDAAATRFH